MKRTLSIILAVVMLASIFTAVPITASASGDTMPVRWNGLKIEFIEQPGITQYGYAVDVLNKDGSLFVQKPYVVINKVGGTYQSENGNKCTYNSKTGVVTTWEVMLSKYVLSDKYYRFWISYSDKFAFSEAALGQDLISGHKGGFWQLEGKAYATGDVCVGNTLWANFSDSSTPAVPSGSMKYTWQRSVSGANSWSDIATGMSYKVTTADKGCDLRLKAQATDYSGYVLSEKMPVVKKQCETSVVKANVGYDGSNIVVTNAKKAQKYFVLNSKDYDEDYIESSWKDAKQPTADGRLTLAPVSKGIVNYVYTKVAETDTHYASVDYTVSDVYCGGGSVTQGVKIEYENLSRSQSEPARVGDVLKLTASCMPASTSDWTGVLGSDWSATQNGAIFYTTSACSSTLSYSTRYTVVYAKLNANKNDVELKASFTNLSGTKLTGSANIDIADSSGKYLLEDIVIPDMPDILTGTTVKNVPFLTVPANASLDNISFSNGYSGLQVTINKTNNTLTFDALNSSVGSYSRQLRRSSTTIVTKNFSVVENNTPIEDLAFGIKSFPMSPGTSWTTYFTLYTYPENANFADVTLSSSDTNLVTVTKGTVTRDGVKYCTADIKITGNATGGETVLITATAPNGKKAMFYVAFSGGEEPAHVHSYDFVDVIKPTANKLGYTRHACYCSDYYDDNFKAPTGKPSGFKCSARTAAAEKFTWNKTSGVTGYQVQILNAKGANAGLKALTGNTYTFTKLAAGHAYKARVRFYITKNGKNYFGQWTTINSPTLPTGTALSKVTPAKRAFTAQWKANKTVTGYQIQYTTGSKSALKAVKGASKVKLSVTGLKGGAKYIVKIRTFKTIGGVNYYSTWSAPKTVTTKK